MLQERPDLIGYLAGMVELVVLKIGKDLLFTRSMKIDNLADHPKKERDGQRQDEKALVDLKRFHIRGLKKIAPGVYQ